MAKRFLYGSVRVWFSPAHSCGRVLPPSQVASTRRKQFACKDAAGKSAAADARSRSCKASEPRRGIKASPSRGDGFQACVLRHPSHHRIGGGQAQVGHNAKNSLTMIPWGTASSPQKSRIVRALRLWSVWFHASVHQANLNNKLLACSDISVSQRWVKHMVCGASCAICSV